MPGLADGDSVDDMQTTDSSLLIARSPTSGAAASLALVVGLASAAISAYWGAGGSWMVKTVGGAFERLGNSGSLFAVCLMSVVVLLKVTVAVLPVAALRKESSPSARRLVRGPAWVAACILTGYGFVYTIGGLMVEVGVLKASAGANEYAMSWHTYFWDPWFLVWGILILVALRTSRPAPPR